MKSFFVYGGLLGLVAEASALTHRLEERQLSGLISLFTGPAKPANVLRTLKPEYNPAATRAVYSYGPFNLQSSTAKHAAPGLGGGGIKLDPNSDALSGSIVPPCVDCTVYKAIANFSFKNGTQADVTRGVYTHHIIIADLGGKYQVDMPISPPMCKNGARLMPGLSMAGMSPKGGSPKAHKRQLGALKIPLSVFIGGGGDMGSGHPFSAKDSSVAKSGYWISKNSKMQLTAEVINYDAIPKDLYLTMDVEWLSGKSKDLLDVGMGALSADRCDDKERGMVHPPKDRAINYRGDEWIVKEDGYFVNFTPHIHDGGTKVEVFLNGRKVCQSNAIYGEQKQTQTGQSWQTIVEYTPCNDAIAIKKGDKIYVSAEYDLTKYKLRPDNNHADVEAEGMVLVNFIFARPFQK